MNSLDRHHRIPRILSDLATNQRQSSRPQQVRISARQSRTAESSGSGSRSADGRKPNGVEVLRITPKKRARRAGDVNPPVRVRARPASAAPGAHQERYRPIDIDRSPGVIGSRRFNGGLKVHGPSTCVSTQKLRCRLALRRGVFPTPSRSWLDCERDKASGGCQSPGKSTCPPGQRRTWSAPGTLPAD
jgi:hypothetical protein